MPNKLFPSDILAQARAVSGGWNKIDPALQIGDLSRNALEANIDQSVPLQTEMDELEAQLTDLRNRRDDLYMALWDQVKRARNGIKGIYGDDSSQYEMVGGTRRSERKPISRKKVAA
jgi:hypothetical protein